MPAGLVLGFDDSDGARAAPTVVGEEARAHGDALEEIGTRLLDEAVATARAAGADVEAHVERERSVDLLLRLAEERDARFIVVGSYGESPLRGAILGSTPHRLLHFSDRPVLAVPAAR
jgi:nucleotide-binding universal stress UspA family protein